MQEIKENERSSLLDGPQFITKELLSKVLYFVRIITSTGFNTALYLSKKDLSEDEDDLQAGFEDNERPLPSALHQGLCLLEIRS